MVRRNRHYPKNSKIWGAPCDPLLGIGPRNLYNTGNQRVSIKKKILDALSQKLREILGGPKIISSPLSQKWVVKFEILLQNSKELVTARRMSNL